MYALVFTDIYYHFQVLTIFSYDVANPAVTLTSPLLTGSFVLLDFVVNDATIVFYL